MSTLSAGGSGCTTSNAPSHPARSAAAPAASAVITMYSDPLRAYERTNSRVFHAACSSLSASAAHAERVFFSRPQRARSTRATHA